MKVLAVDDDKGSLLVLSVMLEKLGYDVLKASAGQEAWSLFKKYQPFLVMTDWQIPNFSGLELAKLIRDYQASEPLTRIILLTALSDDQISSKKVDTAILDAIIQKPFDFTALRAVVEKLAE